MHVDAIVYFDSGGIQCMWMPLYTLTVVVFSACGD